MKKRKIFYFYLIPFVFGIIFGSFYDYQISEAIYMPNNTFGMLFSAFSPWLGYGFLVILSGFIHRFAIKEINKAVKIGLFALSLVGYIVCTWLAAGHVTSINAYNNPDTLWLWILICALVYVGLFFLGDYFGKNNDNKKVLYAALVIALFMIVILVPVAQIAKNIMRRPRFRVARDGTYEAIFVNWWQRFTRYGELKDTYGTLSTDFSEEFKSFPSAHVSVAAVLVLGLPFMSYLCPKLKGKETTLSLVAYVFTLIVAFSRMTMGAHYLSDVSWGGLLMMVAIIFANEICLKYFINENNDVKLN